MSSESGSMLGLAETEFGVGGLRGTWETGPMEFEAG